MSITELKTIINNFYRNKESFQKPKGGSFIISNIGFTTVEDKEYEGFQYSGQNKYVPFATMLSCIEKLESSGKLSREWFNESFPEHKGRPCNYTTIGSILEKMNKAVYIRGNYLKKNNLDN